MSQPAERGAQPLMNVEALTKGVALFSATALGVGFLYDSVYWSIVDSRLSRLYLISDHIETSIASLPFVIASTLAMWVVPLIVPKLRSTPLRAKLLIIAGLIILLALVVGAAVFQNALSLPFFIVSIIGGLLFAVGVRKYLFADRPEGPSTLPFGATPGALIAYTLAIVVAVTSVIAYGRAIRLVSAMEGRTVFNAPKFADLIWLMDRSTVSGEVVRVIERGAIVALRNQSQRLVFIPKEQIWRIDFQ